MVHIYLQNSLFQTFFRKYCKSECEEMGQLTNSLATELMVIIQWIDFEIIVLDNAC